MSASIPYVVTVAVWGTREVIVDAVTAAEAMEIAEQMRGVSEALKAEPQQ